MIFGKSVKKLFKEGDFAMKNIAAKLVKIMEECSYVQKTGKNTFHNYNYATAADVLEKVGAALAKNKVIAITTPELVKFDDTKNARGNTEHLATVKTSLKLIDSESGEFIEACGWGSGQDVGDKAVMKAQTASLKYAWMMLLQISTGDDPEADSGVDERNQITSKQRKPTQSKTTDDKKTPLQKLQEEFKVTDEVFAGLKKKYQNNPSKIRQALEYLKNQQKAS